MTTVRPFQELTVDEKIAFFLHGQKLLLENHPDSDFTIYHHTLPQRLGHIRVIADQYKGLTYQDDNICVLFNHIQLPDPKDPISALRAAKFQPPHKDYNAVSIDFVVFKKLTDCAEWCRNHYKPRIEYAVYVKNGKPQVYKTIELISRALKLPRLS